MSTSGRGSKWSGWLLSLVCALALGACSGPEDPSGQDDNTENNSGSGGDCSIDEDCPEGRYCAASGSCAQDCEPGTGSEGCDGGQVCSERGQCVDAGETCQTVNDCGDPPGGEAFCDGDTAVAPASLARCKMADEDGVRLCAYDDERAFCQAGCDEDTGQCNPEEPDPCEGVSCQMPPEDECKDDGVTLVTYPSEGTCNEGDCAYQPMEMACAAGCVDGACEEVACGQGACDEASPLAPTCSVEEPDVLVSYVGEPICMDEDGQARCNFEANFTDCLYQGARCMDGACEGAPPQTGQVIVTEYMVNPEGAGRPRFWRQWVEVYNTTDAPVDLAGWTLRFDGEEGVTEHTLDAGGEAIPVAPGARAVLANGDDPAGDGSVEPLYEYDQMLMTFEGTLTLVAPDGQVSDLLYWPEGAAIRGRARQLDPGASLTAEGNDDPASWCPNLVDLMGTENYGTPGADNTACVEAPCDEFACGEQPQPYCNADGDAVTFTVDAPTCQVSAFSNPYCDFGAMIEDCDPDASLCLSGICEAIPQNLPAPGEVIFTEFMGNPKGSDSEREWLEVHNTTDGELSLFTLVIEDNETGSSADSWRILDPSLTIPAGGYLVFGPNPDEATNGGITDMVELGVSGLLKNSPDTDMMGQSAMTIRLTLRDGALIDEAYYGEPTEGASQQLDLASYQGMSGVGGVNDGPTNFCAATTEYSAEAGAGTPGADNEACAAP